MERLVISATALQSFHGTDYCDYCVIDTVDAVNLQLPIHNR